MPGAAEAEKASDRLLVVRESELDHHGSDVSAATAIALMDHYQIRMNDEAASAVVAAVERVRGRSCEWRASRTGHPQVGEPTIPLVIVDELAQQLFSLRALCTWDALSQEQKDEWRRKAREFLVDLWGDFVSYFSTPGVLNWAMLTPHDCDVMLTALDCEADAAEVDLIRAKLEAASRLGHAFDGTERTT